MKKFMFAMLAIVSVSAHADQITIKKMSLICPNTSEYFSNPSDQQHYIDTDKCFLSSQEINIQANKTKIGSADVYVFPAELVNGPNGKTMGVISADVKKK